MTVENKIIDGRNFCKLSGDLTIWNAADIWQQIYPLLTSDTFLIIDMQEVGDCDGAGIQIVCQIKKAIEEHKKKISFSGISEPIITAAKQAGLDTELFDEPSEGK
jgi:anti-anti-sigma regulatory factor